MHRIKDIKSNESCIQTAPKSNICSETEKIEQEINSLQSGFMTGKRTRGGVSI